MVIQPYKGLTEKIVDVSQLFYLIHEKYGLLIYPNFYFHWLRAAPEYKFLALPVCVNRNQGTPSHTVTSICNKAL